MQTPHQKRARVYAGALHRAQPSTQYALLRAKGFGSALVTVDPCRSVRLHLSGRRAPGIRGHASEAAAGWLVPLPRKGSLPRRVPSAHAQYQK